MPPIVQDRIAILADRRLPRGAAWRLPLTIGNAFSLTGKFVRATIRDRAGQPKATYRCQSDGEDLTVSGQVITILAPPDAVSEIEDSETTLADVAAYGETEYGVEILDEADGIVLMAIVGRLQWIDPIRVPEGETGAATAVTVGISDATATTVNVSGTGVDGASAYVYIGYASDDEGTGYSDTPGAGLDHIAFLATNTEIETPTASDFAGLWVAITGGVGSGTVTSVAVSGSDGIEVDSGSPITSSGTIAIGIDASALSTHLGLGTAATTAAADYATAAQGTAATAAKAKTDFLTVTGATDLDAIRLKLSGVEPNAKDDQTGAEIKAIYEAESNTNAYTDAEKAKVAATSGTNTGDNAVNSLYSGLVSNATHTGDVTGSTTLTIEAGAVTEAKCNSSINASLDLADSSIQPGNAALTDERVPTSAGLTSKFGTAKGSIVDGDKFGMLDSAATDAPKHTLWSVIKSTLKTYFDTLYSATGHTHAQLHDAATVSGNGIALSGQQISLDIGTGSTQVAAGNHGHSGVYAPVMAITTESTTTRTLALTDAHDWIHCTHASGCSITVPPQTDVAWTDGTIIYGDQGAAGAVTIVAGSGVTINCADTLVTDGQHSAFALVRIASDVWLLTGRLVA